MLNNENMGFYFGICVVLVIISSVISASITHTIMQKQIIEHNAAEWRIDNKTAEVRFHWLDDDDSGVGK